MAQSHIAIPSPEEARKGCSLALENARRHLLCGEAIARAQEYGIAASHMVLAAEEALKSLVLLMLSEGAELPSAAVMPFLTQHRPRHFAGALLALMEFFITSWVDLITALNEKHPDRTTQEYTEARKAAVANFVVELNRIADAAPGEAHVIDVMDWWTHSNLLKQRGFYVDFEQGRWAGPNLVSQSDFTTSHEIASETVHSMERAVHVALTEPAESRRQFMESLGQLIRQRRGGLIEE